jgi:2-desacetyl-2-hydroxyethyl bacteriochlorophyllide A dehydrogenase
VGRTTQAIVFPEPRQVDLITLELPDLGPDDVGIRTVYSGISPGTERWAFTARYNHWDEDLAEHYPHVPGYQRASIVDAVGSEVRDLAVGDRVFSRGAKIVDQELRRRGWFGHSGYVVSPRDQVCKLESTADLEEASLWQMPGVGAHGVRLVDVKPGELVVVIGQGLIGQLSAQMARLRGATVITSDVIQSRVDLSALHSADVAINGKTCDLGEVVRGHQPAGADVVIDTTGNSKIFDYCVELIRREGRICLQGYYPDPFHIEFHPTHEKRATVVFPCGREEYSVIAPLLNRRKVRLKPLITHRFPVQRAKEAYDLILNRPEEALGIVFEWGQIA